METRAGYSPTSGIVLITGATGVLGHQLVPELLRRRPHERFALLLRASDETELAARAAGLCDYAALSAAERRRITLLRGDIRLADLGLGRRYAELARDLGEVFHLGAITRFDVALRTARETNVDGTRNLLRLCERAGRTTFRRFHLVSTAYVSGDRTGRIFEAELDRGQRFENSYERAKFEAESLVVSQSAVPYTVYRPSVIVGDTQTGRTCTFQGFYQLLLAAAGGRLRSITCDPDATTDIVPVDYVARAIAMLSEDNGAVGQAFHVTAGDETTPVREILDDCLAMIACFRADRQMAAVRRPQIVHFTDRSPAAPRRRTLAGSALALAPYMSRHRVFDNVRARTVLGARGVRCPRSGDYLPKVVDFALRRRYAG